jgi:hypothetical protein
MGIGVHGFREIKSLIARFGIQENKMEANQERKGKSFPVRLKNNTATWFFSLLD